MAHPRGHGQGTNVGRYSLSLQRDRKIPEAAIRPFREIRSSLASEDDKSRVSLSVILGLPQFRALALVAHANTPDTARPSCIRKSASTVSLRAETFQYDESLVSNTAYPALHCFS